MERAAFLSYSAIAALPATRSLPSADGLADLAEINGKTSPTNADTEGDGVSDYDELDLFHTDPWYHD